MVRNIEITDEDKYNYMLGRVDPNTLRLNNDRLNIIPTTNEDILEKQNLLKSFAISKDIENILCVDVSNIEKDEELVKIMESETGNTEILFMFKCQKHQFKENLKLLERIDEYAKKPLFFIFLFVIDEA